MDILWQEIKAGWNGAGLRVPPGVTSEQLDAFEKQHGVILPVSISIPTICISLSAPG
ncbi:MAG: hypothetical protein JWN14_2377 [Chthonomonadales bacterium]|nr:hypothetical protein [Chthonomonadales bacterium]